MTRGNRGKSQRNVTKNLPAHQQLGFEQRDGWPPATRHQFTKHRSHSFSREELRLSARRRRQEAVRNVCRSPVAYLFEAAFFFTRASASRRRTCASSQSAA